MDKEMICPKDKGGIIMVEYSLLSEHHYDGISEYACINALESGDCDYRVGRWCGKELAANEIEPRFCEGGKHPIGGEQE